MGETKKEGGAKKEDVKKRWKKQCRVNRESNRMRRRRKRKKEQD